jgi:spore photoproduct lyase
MNQNQWKPAEIIINEQVQDDPVTISFLNHCPNVPVKFTKSSMPTEIVKASDILRNSGPGMMSKVIAGKQVVFIAPAGQAVDEFTMPDDRFVCPHFERLKFASNGCFYHCDWCYLKLTYRAQRPFITIRVEYDKIKKQLSKRLGQSRLPIIFNSGELADSLSMEHLTGAMREFIPWFGQSGNGYLFLLTKSDNVDDILDLSHNGHSILAWSMNNETVSSKFEIGAPGFEQRLEAAYKVQRASYPLRIRLDPIVPFEGWQQAYADTVARIFQKVSPNRITLGTLRFEEGFYTMRNSIFSTGPELPAIMEGLLPMFEPKLFEGSDRPKVGKYSYPEDVRVGIFDFIMREIRKYSDCPIALCKESAEVWNKLGLDLSKCQCVCQLDYADMAEMRE